MNNAAMKTGMQIQAYVYFLGGRNSELELLDPTFVLFLIFCYVAQQLLYQQCMEVPMSQLRGQHFLIIALSMNGLCRFIAPPLGANFQHLCRINTMTMATLLPIAEVKWPELRQEPKQS